MNLNPYVKALVAFIGAAGNTWLNGGHLSPTIIVGYIVAGLVYLCPNAASSPTSTAAAAARLATAAEQLLPIITAAPSSSTAAAPSSSTAAAPSSSTAAAPGWFAPPPA